MSAYGKYRVIAADTLEERKHHRQFIEDKLQKGGLTPALLLELTVALKYARDDERAARDELEDVVADEEKEEKEKGSGSGEGSEGSQSSGGGSQGSGGGGSSSGSGDGGGAHWEENTTNESESGGAEGLSEFEVFELLFLLTETGTTPDQVVDNAPVDAATLWLDRDEGVALVNEPYAAEHAHTPHAPSAMLHALEHHATSVGARSLMLNVHADAVDMFRQKGYQIYGGTATRNGIYLQRMRKMLIRSTSGPKSTPD